MIGSTRYTAAAEVARQTSLSAQIAKLQTSVSTNRRLSAPSDDPNAAARISDIRQSQADNKVWEQNADTGAAVAGAASHTLATVASAMAHAKELIVAGANDTNNTVDRGVIAKELRALADQMTTLSQSTDPNGQPLFPANPIAIPVSPGLSLTATASATQVFGSVTTAQGTKSITDILNAAASALEMGAGDTVATTDADGNATDSSGAPLTFTRAQALAAGVTAITNATDHVASVQTDQGLRGQRFDDAKARLTTGDTDYAAERTGLEEPDTETVITQYQSLQLSLQAAQTMFAQTHKSSLFDLLG